MHDPEVASKKKSSEAFESANTHDPKEAKEVLLTVLLRSWSPMD